MGEAGLEFTVTAAAISDVAGPKKYAEIFPPVGADAVNAPERAAAALTSPPRSDANFDSLRTGVAGVAAAAARVREAGWALLMEGVGVVVGLRFVRGSVAGGY
jgi:hypothetical protein